MIPCLAAALVGDLSGAPLEARPEKGDRFQITLPTQVEGEEPLQGRLIIFLVEERGRFKWEDPIDAPFLRKPQPIASIALHEHPQNGVLALGDDVPGTVSFPERLDELNGAFRVRAVLDRGHTRSHNAPGNWISTIGSVKLVRDEAQAFELTLEKKIPEEPLLATKNLRWIRLKSDVLSKAAGQPIFHRAGVVLPPEYDDPLASRRYWPTIYVIPGFGGDHRDAADFALATTEPAARNVIPRAVWVFLDPNTPLGHHGFVDSENNGPRGKALVKEFIPWLEKRFRLESRINARIITGHSSGGYASLWLQLQYPEIFGACFSSAPDPVSFDAFGTINLYHDLKLQESNDGEPRASMRRWLTPEMSHVDLFVGEELAMERAIAPDGTSGEQWDTWNAMFSPKNRVTGLPQSAWDPETGELDAFVIESGWVPHDIALLVKDDWERYGTIIENRVRLLCGAQDSFYLERAVERLKAIVDQRRSPESRGYIELIDGADHSTIVPMTRHRWFQEMQSFLDGTPPSE